MIHMNFKIQIGISCSIANLEQVLFSSLSLDPNNKGINLVKDDNYTFYGKHYIMYWIVKSLC